LNSEFRIPNSEFKLHIEVLGLWQVFGRVENGLDMLGEELAHLLRCAPDETCRIEKGFEL